MERMSRRAEGSFARHSVAATHDPILWNLRFQTFPRVGSTRSWLCHEHAIESTLALVGDIHGEREAFAVLLDELG
jgi:hypothetical protein